jgi:hypothetical protein
MPSYYTLSAGLWFDPIRYINHSVKWRIPGQYSHFAVIPV